MRTESGPRRFVQNRLSPLELWWPGTESNRRRQPFQGCGHFFKGLRLSRMLRAIRRSASLTPSAADFSNFENEWWPGTESNSKGY